MKKIITLLLAVGAFAAADAQTTKEEARRVILGGGNNKGTNDNGTVSNRDVILGDNEASRRRDYPVSTSESSQIDQINRQYDAKIVSIRNNRTLTSEEKTRIIRDLERERQRKINQVRDRYDDNDKRNKKNKDYKNNRGKHKGWTKGKGNKHRDRDDD